MDTVGNVYITGSTAGSLPGFAGAGTGHPFLARYDTNGNRTLAIQLGTLSGGGAKAIEVDVSGNIYISGSTSENLNGETNSGGTDAFVTKLDSVGNVLWIRLYGGTNTDQGRALGLDANGHVWMGGISLGSVGDHINAGGYDAFVAEYNTDGSFIDSKFLASSGDEVINDLSIGPDGSAYLTGYTDGALGLSNVGIQDVFVVKIVPEPSTALFGVIGMLGLCFRRIRK